MGGNFVKLIFLKKEQKACIKKYLCYTLAQVEVCSEQFVLVPFCGVLRDAGAKYATLHPKFFESNANF